MSSDGNLEMITASVADDKQQGSAGAVTLDGPFVVFKCIATGTDAMQRLRTKWPKGWKAFDSTLSKAYGQPMAAKYEDEEGDWCTVTEMSFGDFSAVVMQALETPASKTPVVKLHVSPVHLLDNTMKRAFVSTMPTETNEMMLLLPDGIPPDPSTACGPKPFLMSLQQLSHGSVGGWTSENLCVLLVAFYPTLMQRAQRKIEKLNKNGPDIVDKIRPALQEVLKALEQRTAPGCVLVPFLRAILQGERAKEFGIFVSTFAHFLHTLPVPEQKNLLKPALTILISAEPNIFAQLFDDKAGPPAAEMNHRAVLSPLVELPCGMQVPKLKILEPQQLQDQQKVHLVGLGVKRNGWANLCIGPAGRVHSTGALGDFATFKVHLKGSEEEGFQKVALESCAGKGFLVHDGSCSQLQGGADGCAALFVLEPLGLKGMKEEKAPAFALRMASGNGDFVGVDPSGLVFSASATDMSKSFSKDECGGFLLVQHGIPKQWLPAGAGPAGGSTKEAKKESKQLEKIAAQEAKEAEKAEKASAKEAKQAEKIAAKEAKEAEKAEKIAAKEAKEAEKIAAKEAKQAEKNSRRESKQANKMACVPVMDLTQLKEGCLVHLQSAVTGMRLVIDGKVNVHAQGGFGQWATFKLHILDHDTTTDTSLIALESKPNVGQYLRSRPGHKGPDVGGNFDGWGKGPKETGCAFELAKVIGEDDSKSEEVLEDSKEKVIKQPYFQLKPLHADDAEMNMKAFRFQLFAKQLDAKQLDVGDRNESGDDWVMANAE